MTRWTKFVRELLARSLSDRKGGITVMTAMSLTALMGFAGLGTEASYWYVKQRSMQGAVDAASFTAAAALMNGETVTAGQPATGTPVNSAKAIAAQYGFVDGANGVTVTVNSPPTPGTPNAGNAKAVEVIIQQTQTPLLSALFMSNGPTIAGRAVSIYGTSCSSGSCGCILSLDRGNVVDVSNSGATVNIPTCSMYINSNDTHGALSMSGSTASITAYSTYIVGNTFITGGAHLTDSNGTHVLTASPVSDPYAGEQIPSDGGCHASGTNYNAPSGSTNIQPCTLGGVITYNGGITVNAGSTLNLAAGTYIMNGGSFNVNGGTITGDGVTIILTGPGGSSDATVNITGGSTVTLNENSPPAQDGLTFFQDPNASGGTNSFSGNAAQNINGAIYMPNELVNFSGGATTGGAQCTELIAYQITFSGSTTFSNNCSGTGVKSFGNGSGTASVTLVE